MLTSVFTHRWQAYCCRSPLIKTVFHSCYFYGSRSESLVLYTMRLRGIQCESDHHSKTLMNRIKLLRNLAVFSGFLNNKIWVSVASIAHSIVRFSIPLQKQSKYYTFSKILLLVQRLKVISHFQM